MNEKAKLVDQFLAKHKITFTAIGGQRTTRDNGGKDSKPWECFAWECTFTNPALGVKTGRKSFQTPFYCGLSHVKPSLYVEPRPQPPCAADVLYSLILDGEATHMSFDDWCANFGYDNDSISALNTYRTCCTLGHKLEQFFTRPQREQLRKLLEDY